MVDELDKDLQLAAKYTYPAEESFQWNSVSA
jgi:hypothetical protein